MDLTAKVTSKGQITIPKEVRKSLGLETGDRVLFRVDSHRALIAKTPELLELAGTVDVPATKRGTPWDEVRRQTFSSRANAGR